MSTVETRIKALPQRMQKFLLDNITRSVNEPVDVEAELSVLEPLANGDCPAGCGNTVKEFSINSVKQDGDYRCSKCKWQTRI